MTDTDALLKATWPPVRSYDVGPFTLREGAGGGKRVEAATTRGDPTDEQVAAAERAMDAAGTRPLFALRPDQAELDRMLTRRGYLVLDPTLLLSGDIRPLAERPTPPVSGFTAWPHLQVQRDIWADGNIGAGRLAVMDRVSVPKTTLLGRMDDRPAAAAFVAVSDDVAVVHALEVRRAARRKGMAGLLMAHAARWAAQHGARRMAVLVTEANTGALALYRGLGMEGSRCYHYRVRP